jgi:hypothetical protein
VPKIRLFQQEVTEIPNSVPLKEKGKNFDLLSVIISFFFILVTEEICRLLDDKNGDTNRTDNERINIEARSRNHCCCRKAVSITYSECVSAAVVI